MKFKIKDFVWFYPEDVKNLPFDDMVKSVGKEWAGEIKKISIDENNNVVYSIQTYMLYSPYKYFDKIPEEGCFVSQKELQCDLIEHKLAELESQKKQLETLKNNLPEDK